MKARLAAGETLFGSFLTLGSPLAAETLGLAGFDWLLVDLEHGGGDESQLLGQLLGARAAGVHALVRVESDVRGRTARSLDLGVEGVMCPQINSAEQAEAWASALHYGPAGSRVIAFFHRGARFGTETDPVGAAGLVLLGIGAMLVTFLAVGLPVPGGLVTIAAGMGASVALVVLISIVALRPPAREG